MITAVNGVLWPFPVYMSPPVGGGSVAFMQVDGVAGTADSNTFFSFDQTIASQLTNGYIVLATRYSTPNQSGNNIAATFAGTGMTPIPLSGSGAQGLAYNSNRSIHIRGIAVGSLPPGTYTFTERISGGGSSIGYLAASMVFNNVNQTTPTGMMNSSGASFTSNRLAYVDVGDGDLAIGLYGAVNQTGVSGIGPGQFMPFNSGNNNILAAIMYSGTSPSTTISGRTTGSSNTILGAFPLRKA